MYWHLIPVPMVLLAIYLYVVARSKNDLRRVAVVQPLATILIIVVCALSLLSSRAVPGFTVWILVGLVLSLIGDFLNVDMTDQKTVMVGLIIFVFAYLVYPIGVTVYNGFHTADIIVTIFFLIYLVVFIAYLWPGLGSMKVPVIIYGAVLCFMVSRAVSTFFGGVFSTAQAVLLTAGTGMIFVGDSLFALETYKKPAPPPLVMRLKVIGPLLYAGGQLLIGLSPSYFPGN